MKMPRRLSAESHFKEYGFPLHVAAVAVGAHDISAHEHDFVEAVFVSAGQGQHRIEYPSGAVSYPIAAGDIFLITPDLAHAYHDNQDLVVYNILFQPNLFGDDAVALCAMPGLINFLIIEPLFREEDKFSQKLHLTPSQATVVQEHLDQIIKELEQGQPGFRLCAKSLLMEMLVRIGRFTDGLERGETQLNDERQRLIEDALQYIEKNYSEQLSLEDIATQVYLSPNYFSEVFKSSTGIAPWEYVTKMRLDEACELLRHTKRSITDIALSVGFSDSSYFAKVFKERFAQTPSAYRKA